MSLLKPKQTLGGKNQTITRGLMTKIFLLLLNLIILDYGANAQSLFLSGSIKNAATLQPIDQSSLKINHKQIGTVSNAEGKFMLLTSDLSDADSLIISCVGYQTLTLTIGKLKSAETEPVYLIPITFNLNEVTIHQQPISETLKEAIYATDALIPTEDNLKAYYKEYAYLDHKLFKYADAAVNYRINNKDKKTKVTMYVMESRTKKDSVTKENKWRSDVESLITPDKALKEYYNLKYLYKFVNAKQLEKYTFRMQSNGNISKISIDPKTEVHQYLPNAIIYINTLTKRVIKVEYAYITHLQYMPKVNLIFLAYSCEKDSMISIYSEGEHPFLRYCELKQDIRFKVGSKKGLLGSIAEVLVHNDNEPQSISIGNDNIYKKSTIFKNGNHFSTDFWYKYNTILPTGEELKELSF